MSIVGKDSHADEHVVGYYNTGDRMKYWGKTVAFWGGGPYLWGASFYPAGLAIPTTASREAMAARVWREATDSHLRSTEAVTGYHLEAADGELGHVNGFLVDDEDWAIRYIEVSTRNWWPGKGVLVSPAWIERVSWTEARVYVGLSREGIKDAPEYVESRTITREYENRLFLHYGRPQYWLHEGEHKPSLSLSGV